LGWGLWITTKKKDHTRNGLACTNWGEGEHWSHEESPEDGGSLNRDEVHKGHKDRRHCGKPQREEKKKRPHQGWRGQAHNNKNENKPLQGWRGKDKKSGKAAIEIKGESSSNAACVFSRC